MADIGIPLDEWNGSRATAELHETIKQFNVAAEKQTEQMLRLTRTIAWLTGVMVVAVLLQVALALVAP